MAKRASSCVKWLLALLNLVFLICGLFVCGVAVWMLISPSMTQMVFGSSLSTIVTYFLIGSGCTIVVISFSGCAGAGLENRCLLCFFFTMLCSIFVASLVLVFLIAIFHKDLTNLTKERLSTNLQESYGDSQSWTDFWNLIQTKFSCCAVENNKSFVIYQKTPWYRYSKPSRVPDSCCIKNGNGDYFNLKLCQTGNKNSVYTTGCMTAIINFFVTRSIIILVILNSLAVSLVCSMMLSLIHLRNIINTRFSNYSHPV